MNLRILKSIGLYFIYPLCAFLLGILTHIGYVKFFYPGRYDYRMENMSYLTEDAVTVSDSLGTITTCDTRFIVKECNLSDGSEQEIEKDMPEKYWGMTREQFMDALAEYEINPTLEDIEKGFLSLQLESFSSSEVLVRKDYQLTEEDNGYYLCVQDGKIVVMENDRNTVYLTTDIYVEALSDGLKQELILGKFIQDLDDLYGFLESYTS